MRILKGWARALLQDNRIFAVLVGHIGQSEIQHYRVRALNARIQSMRRTTLISTCKNEAVEPRTIANIVEFLSGLIY
jgi:hypothetical protein